MMQPTKKEMALDIRDPFAHEDTDDTESVTVIRGGHAFGKMQGACPRDSDRSASEPLTRSFLNEQSPNEQMSSRRRAEKDTANARASD